MKMLPFPVRIAAGLVAVAIEQARDFPRVVIELPVVAISQALQVSMRVQQKVSELAIKGDRLLGTVPPIEEKPTWAASDEKEPLARNGTDPITELRPVTPATTGPVDEPRVDSPEADAVVEDLPPVVFGTEEVRANAVTDEWAGEVSVGEVSVEADATAVDAPEADVVLEDLPPVVTGAEEVRADAVTDEWAAEDIIAETSAHPVDPSEPPALSGYAEMSIAQLGSNLTLLGLDDLQALLAWEMAHGERPPFVTMLTNRISMVMDE